MYTHVKSWENASLVKLIHIFERGGFLYNSFLFGNTKKPKTTYTHTQKEKGKAQSDSERVKSHFLR